VIETLERGGGEAMSVLVTLAAHNEERNVGRVVRRVRKLGYKCVVVDDGSSDKTAKVALAAGAEVVSHAINLGQGDALLTGFKVCLLDPHCEIIVEMDADGQHDPADVPRFVDKIRESGADIVVGSRILGSHQPNVSALRRFFLPYYTELINRLTGYEMTDALCGFRAFRRESIERVAPLLNIMIEPQYVAAEMFIRFSRRGLRVIEIPIRLADRSSGLSRKGVLRYGFGILRAISRTLVDPRLGP
jgi:glycosyltransferase involved in cell wall biosynthesis